MTEQPNPTQEQAITDPEGSGEQPTAAAPTDVAAHDGHAPETGEAPHEAKTTATDKAAAPGQAVTDAVPEEAEATAVPEQAEATAVPEQAEATAVPEQAEATAVPEQAEATAVPEQAESAAAVDQAAPAGSETPQADAAEASAPSAEANGAADAAPEPVAAAAPHTPGPGPGPRPRPVPRPQMPAPAAAPAVAPPPVDAHDAAEAAAWGRVDEDGTVWVREAAGERMVGQYTGADREEALGFYVRRFLDLQAQVALFEARLGQISPKEIDQTLATLDESLVEPAAVGDVAGLRERLARVKEVAEERRREAAAERDAARARAVAERTTIVEKAEEIAEQDPGRTQWKQSGQHLRDLLDEWKAAQRGGPRLDRPTEDKLWKRFSHARTTFDRRRRQYFSELDASQGQVKASKEKLIARAEELASSTDWGRTTAQYRALMDEWKAAGRASRKDDDALWARFRAAQQKFFDARNAQNAEIDAEYSENLKAKLVLLEQAEAILPVTDPRAAREALRPIQDAWEEAGKVPRADVQRVEGRMRAVEQAVRAAEDEHWHRSNPETKARVEGATAQLTAVIEQLEADLDRARAGGDAGEVAAAEAALQARRAWLDQIQRAAD